MRERWDERSTEGKKGKRGQEEIRREETGGRRELRSSRKVGGLEGGGIGQKTEERGGGAEWGLDKGEGGKEEEEQKCV